MVKEYKVYLYYLKDLQAIPKERRKILSCNEGFLYGYTLTKKMAKMWEKQRNMKLFKKETKILTEEALNNLYSLFKSGQIVIYSDKTMNPDFTIDPFEIAITHFEKAQIKMESAHLIYTTLRNISHPDSIFFFIKPIRDLLLQIGYVEYFYPSSVQSEDDELPFGTDLFPIRADDLYTFIHIYKSLLKEI